MISSEEEALRAVLARVQNQHDTCYAAAEPDFELMPMYFLLKRGETHLSLGIPSIPPGGKDMVVALVAAKAADEGCDGYVFTSEGWTVPPENVALVLPGESLSGRPDRIEVLNVEAGLAGGQSAFLIAHIKRTPDHSPVLEWKSVIYNEAGGENCQSRFNIFNPRAPQVPDSFVSHRQH